MVNTEDVNNIILTISSYIANKIAATDKYEKEIEILKINNNYNINDFSDPTKYCNYTKYLLLITDNNSNMSKKINTLKDNHITKLNSLSIKGYNDHTVRLDNIKNQIDQLLIKIEENKNLITNSTSGIDKVSICGYIRLCDPYFCDESGNVTKEGIEDFEKVVDDVAAKKVVDDVAAKKVVDDVAAVAAAKLF